MADPYKAMLAVPQLRRQLGATNGNGPSHLQMSELTQDWVNGRNPQEIAQRHFSRGKENDEAMAIAEACRTNRRSVVNGGNWGVAVLGKLAGIDFDSLTPIQQRKVKLLPAMICHGLRTEDAVLTCMNFAPRGIAESLGQQ